MNYLLVGCTGSLGKVILYTLLKTTDHTLFVVIREKDGKTIEQRIKEIMSSIDLDYEKYSNRNRIHLIKCAYDQNRSLCISDKDRNVIIEKINVFLNALADINFNRGIKKATLNNCTTALNWMNLYNQCKNVIQYNYVSTAFTGFHCVDSMSLGKAVESIKEEFHFEKDCGQTFEKCEKTYADILGGLIDDTNLEHSVFENSYTYTKNLTELLLAKNIKQGKLLIVRPSIIVSSVKLPYRGWGSFQTFHVFILGMITGRCLFYKIDYNNCVLNTVPIDMVAEDCIQLINDEKCQGIQENTNMAKIIHSCLTHNSSKWNQEDVGIYTNLPNDIYTKYSLYPLCYKNKSYQPSSVKIFKSRFEYWVGIVFMIIKQILYNISRFGWVRGISETQMQIFFTLKYNQVFGPFSTKNCCFKREMEIHPRYLNVSHKDILVDFINNIPELIKHENISWL
jgi:thioester reductase-like protein